MSDAQRSALSPGDPEYNMRYAQRELQPWTKYGLVDGTADTSSRVIGAKIQVAGWTTAACLLWTLKLCMTFFFLRLMVRPLILEAWTHKDIS
jgi:hypothetical protein